MGSDPILQMGKPEARITQMRSVVGIVRSGGFWRELESS